MYSFIYGSERDLLLGEELVGHRVSISIGHQYVFIWDMDNEIFKKVQNGFKNMHIELEKKQSIEGKVVNGVFITENEDGVFEIDSINCLRYCLQLLLAKADIYARLQVTFDDYVQRLIKQLEISGITYKDGNIDRENMVFSCRFIGGIKAWKSSGMYALDKEVRRHLDGIVFKLQQSLPSPFEMYGASGEKAMYYFHFYVKGL